LLHSPDSAVLGAHLVLQSFARLFVKFRVIIIVIDRDHLLAAEELPFGDWLHSVLVILAHDGVGVASSMAGVRVGAKRGIGAAFISRVTAVGQIAVTEFILAMGLFILLTLYFFGLKFGFPRRL